MKSYQLWVSTLFSVSALGCGSVALAATCNATQGNIDGSNSSQTIHGNTCGHNSNFNGATFCGGVSFSNTGTDAYQVTLGASQNFSFTVTSPGSGTTAFTPDVALVSTNCTDNASCTGENTTGTATVTNPFSGTFTGKPAGTYYIYVTDSTGVGGQCGDYDLSFSGTLPVKLQKFSVK